MSWFERWQWHRAAKAYARRLGSRLAISYGGELPYTPEQIETAVRGVSLDPRYIAIGYAQFAEAATYDGLTATLAKPIERHIARLLFERYRPWGAAPSDAFEPAPNRVIDPAASNLV